MELRRRSDRDSSGEPDPLVVLTNDAPAMKLLLPAFEGALSGMSGRGLSSPRADRADLVLHVREWDDFAGCAGAGDSASSMLAPAAAPTSVSKSTCPSVVVTASSFVSWLASELERAALIPTKWEFRTHFLDVLSLVYLEERRSIGATDRNAANGYQQMSEKIGFKNFYLYLVGSHRTRTCFKKLKGP